MAETPDATKDCQPKDYFVARDGILFAGTHLLIELWEAHHLGNTECIERMLRKAVDDCGATLLHLHLHHFGPNAGVSGVAVLAESHISIHTWPERGYAAIDAFMCGSCSPYDALEAIRGHLEPGHVQLSEHRRGVVSP